MSKYVIDNTTLTSIGNAIREKEGSSGAIKVSDFATRISAIEGGGGSGEGGLVLTGDISNAFNIRQTTTYITELKENLERMYEILFTEEMKTKDITNFSYTFAGYSTGEDYPQITTIPFDINIQEGIYANAAYAFINQAYLTALPKINGGISNLQYTFWGIHRAANFEEVFANVELSPSLASLNYTFCNCSSMRSLPKDFFKDCTKIKAFGSAFSGCYVLDEINNLGVYDGTLTSNVFSDTFNNCSRLKSLTFTTNDDGTPIKADWKSQTINLTGYIGYCYSGSPTNVTGYNSGITNDTKVTNAATYEALKDNPDWWTTSVSYSRYNHDSAVETINSLPDTSHYGTNTIKFKSTMGIATDGGGMENLTEEEIAVAAAKGWTVSLTS